jgi:hypothetical protein
MKEFKSVSTKLSREEVTLLKDFCKKKGTTPAALIRKLILKELNFPVPSNVAGRNNFSYDKAQDKFTWSVKLDKGTEAKVLNNISASFLEDLEQVIERALSERSTFIGKTNVESVAIPSDILRRKR